MLDFDVEAGRDAWFALQLLCGDTRRDKNGLPRLMFLSRSTQPTENEARRALCRALRHLAQQQRTSSNPQSVLFSLLVALAAVFDPDDPPFLGVSTPFRAVLKKRTRGHANPPRDLWIAGKVEMLRLKYGKSYEKAIEEVADRIEKSTEHVKKIYGKNRKRITLKNRWGRRKFRK
jgi:hypothetical protein